MPQVDDRLLSICCGDASIPKKRASGRGNAMATGLPAAAQPSSSSRHVRTAAGLSPKRAPIVAIASGSVFEMAWLS